VYHGGLSGIEGYEDSIVNTQLSVLPLISTSFFNIRFYVSEEEEIGLKVYNKAGIMVRDLFTGKKPAGTHTITWEGNNNLDKALPNDVYFICLKKGAGENIVRKIVLLR
jgi:flagellar hook assembly protein FlgD